MPRYVIERSCPDGLAIPVSDKGVALKMVDRIGEVCALDPCFYL
jgi:hypothetical protein